jgi:hypothetical protein
MFLFCSTTRATEGAGWIGSRPPGIGFPPTSRSLISFDKSALLSQITIFAGFTPEAVGRGACQLRKRMPQRLRRTAALPQDVLGPVISWTFDRSAATCAALAISRSSADREAQTIPVDRQLIMGLFSCAQQKRCPCFEPRAIGPR